MGGAMLQKEQSRRTAPKPVLLVLLLLLRKAEKRKTGALDAEKRKIVVRERLCVRRGRGQSVQEVNVTKKKASSQAGRKAEDRSRAVWW